MSRRRTVVVGVIGAVALVTGWLVPNVASAAAVLSVEAEAMTRTGGSTVSSPFAGVVLFSNGDRVSSPVDITAAGRYHVDVRGASSDSRAAGVTVYVDDAAGPTLTFTGTAPATVTSGAFDIPSTGSHTLQLRLTTDTGANDTLLDSVALYRDGDLTGAPNPPSTGAFSSGVYRNLFAERGYSAAAVRDKLDAAWNSLFTGTDDDRRVYYPVGDDKAYILDVANGDVRSEGMSYGMTIAVEMNKKAEFDRLWTWARTYMYHADPAHPAYGYFSWEMKTDGTPCDEQPAPDGEEYFATALFLASHRWGDGSGIYAYGAQARAIVDQLKNRASITGTLRQISSPGSNCAGSTPSTSTRTDVALFNPEKKQVRFTPDTSNFTTNGDHTDPSYHTPAFYELFSRWGPASDSAFWHDAATTSRQFFQDATNDTTCLAPDYANFDGSAKSASWDSNTKNFRFDAWRTAMNWSVDHAWWAADGREKALSDCLQAFFQSKGLATYGNQFTLDGSQTSGDHSPGLVAMNAVASLAATNSRAWGFVDELWNLPVPTGRYRYYDGMLYILALLHVSGTFQIYGGAAATAPPATTPPATTPPASTPPATTPPASTPPAATPPASTPAGSGAVTTLEAESSTEGSGVTAADGAVTFSSASAYAVYRNVDFGDPVSGVTVRARTIGSGVNVVLRLDGVGGTAACTVYPDGGDRWVDATNSCYPRPTGVHDLYVTVTAPVTIDRFTFSRS